jgi:hypothetical protein
MDISSLCMCPCSARMHDLCMYVCISLCMCACMLYIVTILSEYMGFGMVILFIELLQNVTTSNYSDIANSYILYNSLQHALRLFSLLCLHQSLSGNGFQRRTFPLLWVPELSPCLSYQLLTATAHKD